MTDILESLTILFRPSLVKIFHTRLNIQKQIDVQFSVCTYRYEHHHSLLMPLVGMQRVNLTDEKNWFHFGHLGVCCSSDCNLVMNIMRHATKKGWILPVDFCDISCSAPKKSLHMIKLRLPILVLSFYISYSCKTFSLWLMGNTVITSSPSIILLIFSCKSLWSCRSVLVSSSLVKGVSSSSHHQEFQI